MPLTNDSSVDWPARPNGQSKILVEQILADLCRADPRCSAAVLRHFNPVRAHTGCRIGEGSHGGHASLVPDVTQVPVGYRPERSVFSGDFPTSDAKGLGEFINVVDVAEGSLAAMEQTLAGPWLHLGNLVAGRSQSVLDVVATLNCLTGQRLTYRFAPRCPVDTALSWADPSRAERDLGWKACRSLEQMLADHWGWRPANPQGYRG